MTHYESTHAKTANTQTSLCSFTFLVITKCTVLTIKPYEFTVCISILSFENSVDQDQLASDRIHFVFHQVVNSC